MNCSLKSKNVIKDGENQIMQMCWYNDVFAASLSGFTSKQSPRLPLFLWWNLLLGLYKPFMWNSVTRLGHPLPCLKLVQKQHISPAGTDYNGSTVFKCAQVFPLWNEQSAVHMFEWRITSRSSTESLCSSPTAFTLAAVNLSKWDKTSLCVT